MPFLINFCMLPVYTRFMSPDDYGVLALLNTLSALLPVLTVYLFALDYAGMHEDVLYDWKRIAAGFRERFGKNHD